MERQQVRYESPTIRPSLVEHKAYQQAARVLLITPHNDTADRLATVLTDAGYEVQHAPDAAQASAWLDTVDSPTIALIEFAPMADAAAAIDDLRTAAPSGLRVVVLGDEGSAETTAEADAFLELSPEPQALLRLVQSQVRVAQQIAELETSRASLLSAAIFSMELTQSMRSELGMQQTLHHELLHRVQTHIGALRDYLDLEVRRLPLGIAREAMRGVFYRVRNLSSMYDTMAMLAMNEVVEFGQLAEKMSQGVKAMYSPRSKLPVVVEGQLLLSAASASPLTLIVNELVTNAYKHAFPGGRFGTIHISCGQDKNIGWCVVSDDGVGVDLPLKTRPNSGVHLVRQLTRRTLGGECTWQRTEQGTSVKVQFPLAAP